MGSSYLNEYRSILMLILEFEDRVEETEHILGIIEAAKIEEPELGIEALSKNASVAIDCAINCIPKDYSFSNSKELERVTDCLKADIVNYRRVLNDLYNNLTEPIKQILANEEIDMIDDFGSVDWLREHLNSSKNSDARRRRNSYRKQLSTISDDINPIRLESNFTKSDDVARSAFLI